MPGKNRRRQTDSRFARKERAKTFCTYFMWQIRFVHARILHYDKSISRRYLAPETRVSCGSVCVILRFAVLVEHRLVTDGHRHRRTQAHG